GHEVDRLRGDELRGHRQVALVLAVLVIADDDHLALADVVDRLLDRREGRRGGGVAHDRPPAARASRWASTRRSRCLARMSTSTLTWAPCRRSPSIVRLSVSGISDTAKPRSLSALTVRLTPSSA